MLPASDYVQTVWTDDDVCDSGHTDILTSDCHSSTARPRTIQWPYIVHCDQWHCKFNRNTIYCLTNALHSSIGQNIKSLACPVSDLRSPMSGQSVKKTSNDHNSATRHPIDFVLGSRLGFFSNYRLALFNLTVHELHELNYDRFT